MRAWTSGGMMPTFQYALREIGCSVPGLAALRIIAADESAARRSFVASQVGFFRLVQCNCLEPSLAAQAAMSSHNFSGAGNFGAAEGIKRMQELSLITHRTPQKIRGGSFRHGRCTRPALPGLEAEIFHYQGRTGDRGDVGVVIGRRHFDDIHGDKIHVRQLADDAGGLVIGQSARNWRSRARRHGRIEAIDIESEIGF